MSSIILYPVSTNKKMDNHKIKTSLLARVFGISRLKKLRKAVFFYTMREITIILLPRYLWIKFSLFYVKLLLIGRSQINLPGLSLLIRCRNLKKDRQDVNFCNSNANIIFFCLVVWYLQSLNLQNILWKLLQKGCIRTLRQVFSFIFN